MVTISTVSCVRARSGAENQTKVAQVTRPAPPDSVRAASRWYFACQAAPTGAHHADDPQASEFDGQRQRRPIRRREIEQAERRGGHHERQPYQA